MAKLSNANWLYPKNKRSRRQWPRFANLSQEERSTDLSNIQAGRNIKKMTSIHTSQLKSHNKVFRELTMMRKRCMQSLTSKNSKQISEISSKSFSKPIKTVNLIKNVANKISGQPF